MIALLIIGVILSLAGIVLIIIGKVVYFTDNTSRCSSYFCYYYSSTSSILVGVGSAALALGCIISIITFFIKKRK